MNKLLAAAVLLALSGAAAAAPEFSSEEARMTARDFADKLEESYLDPEIGANYASLLRERASAGVYDVFDSPERFAEAATVDVRSIYPDGHLKLRVDKQREKTGESASAPPVDFKAFQEMRWMADGVVYAKWNAFLGDADSMAAARSLLTAYSPAKAVIFDMRGHHGGGLDEQDVIFSALFGKPTRLVKMRIREGKGRMMAESFDAMRTMHRQPTANGVDVWEHWAEPAADGAPLASAKVFVLTDGKTASAGEHFVLALKTTGRGVIVGEKTRGAGNFGGIEKIGSRFTAFIAVGQTIDPATGKGWDAVGIEPDFHTPADEALAKALSLIGQS